MVAVDCPFETTSSVTYNIYSKEKAALFISHTDYYFPWKEL